MLKILRKKGVSKKILWAVIVIIIFAFGFGGTAYMVARQQQKIKYAGKIFGQTISFEDYDKAYQETTVQFILRYGDNFSKIRQYLDLDAETWNRLILLYEANRRHIKVTDKEIIELIEQFPMFQRNKKFDNELYNNMLRYGLNIRPRPFEENIRNAIKLNKLSMEQTASLNLTDDQIFDAYKKQNEKTQINYVLFSADQFKKEILVDETETQKYYADQKDAFLVPPSISFEYLEFPFPIEKQAVDNKEQDDNEQAKNLLQEKASVVYNQLAAGADLAKTAQENNIEIKTTDFFSMEKPNLSLGWPYEILANLFQIDAVNFHEPFETSNGICIVRIKEKRDAYVPEYATIKEDVKNALIEKKAQKLSQEKAQQTISSIKENYNQSKDFKKTAQDLNLTFYQTPIFKRGDYLETIGISKLFEDAAFELTEINPISDVIKTGKGFCILHLEKYVPVDETEYKKDKETFAEKLITEMKDKSFGEFLTSLKLKAKLEDNISKLKKEQQQQ